MWSWDLDSVSYLCVVSMLVVLVAASPSQCEYKHITPSSTLTESCPVSLCLSGSLLGVAWPPIGLRNNFNRVASPAAVKVRGNMITWSQVYRFLLWKCHSHNNIVKLFSTFSLSQKCLSVKVTKISWNWDTTIGKIKSLFFYKRKI